MALTLERRSVSGEATGSVDLDESVFGIAPNVAVMHQVVTAQLAAARSGTQSTKTRAEVSGGGKKPFKQKGTGRARQGSERAPHFAGGGVALGPKPRSYKQKTPRKMIQLALRSALSDRAAEDRIVVVDEWPWTTPSTREARGALSALGLEGRVLVVLGRGDEEAYKSFRNLPDVQLILRSELNAYDVLCNDWIVFTTETLPTGTSPASGTPAGTAGPSTAEPAADSLSSDSPSADSPSGPAGAAPAGEDEVEAIAPSAPEATAEAAGAPESVTGAGADDTGSDDATDTDTEEAGR